MAHAKAPPHGSPRAAIEMSNDCTLAGVEGAAVLRCPRCRGGNLHHGAVTVNQRRGEDGPGNATYVKGGLAHVKQDDSAFTGRRDCLAISFECEQCGDVDFVLRVQQHKGNTFVYWELPTTSPG